MEMLMSTQKKMTLALLLAFSLAIVVPTTAYAQDNGYEDNGEDIAGNLQESGDTGSGELSGVGGDTSTPTAGTVASDAEGGSLPFTGLDLALILGMGAALVGAGLATRRLTRHVDTT
jgi:hypothetical protein